ncbi:hypothetical protein DLE60_03445 [Micromonospora globispora]|uniref:CHAT domain-containing protein n=1 Tax=Micromonospora globispora TaxID=1450148 RepID=UPI000D6EF928|nr:CHAT domain-containing protein [Micromonospora globispora]PWU61864.1 hypothetical protein DLE60_03445 [Micromonospora globispora]RQW98453.1 hypothetical protein DKL51_10390 [Micromonospora globispora]
MQQERVAWLLRVNRLYGQNEQWLRGAVFAAAFQGGCWPERTSVYRISRWETARVRVPYLAVRRYEELLQLPTNSLVAPIDTIDRYSAATVGSAALLGRRPHEGSPLQVPGLEELIEVARSDEMLTGADWDELASYLAIASGQAITPGSAGTDIAERALAARAPRRHILISAAKLGQASNARPTGAAGARQSLIARIADAVMANMPRHVPNFYDHLIPVLLDELLFHPVSDVRLSAAVLLFGTPYRRPLATALAAELPSHAAASSIDVAPTMIEAPEILGEQENLRQTATGRDGLWSPDSGAALRLEEYLYPRELAVTENDLILRDALVSQAINRSRKRETVSAEGRAGAAVTAAPIEVRVRGDQMGADEQLVLAEPNTHRPVDPKHVLVAQMPSQVPVATPLSLLVRICRQAEVTVNAPHVTLDKLRVGVDGVVVTVIVNAGSGLSAQGPRQQDIEVSPCGDPAPIRFEFVAAAMGLQKVQVTAWVGGTFLGELTLEVSVTQNALYRDAPPRSASLAPLVPNPGEATLQVLYDGVHYRFQLLSSSHMFEMVHVDSLAAQPGPVVERTIAELDQMARGRSGYSGGNASRWLRNAGIQLWSEMVPAAIKDQFWEIQPQISSFTIASDRDVIPWELLHPLAPSHDEGFLVEQFPVLRRVYNQQRSHRISLSNPRFVVPENSPTDAKAEVRTIRETLGVATEPDIDELDALLNLIDAGELGMAHFACHNNYRREKGGSAIKMRNGNFSPLLLNDAAATKNFAATHPLVFINACRSAGAVPQYTELMGFAQRFMAAGAGAFVGTLWAVHSSRAAAFAEVFYQQLVAGETLGAATKCARVEIGKHSADPTWLAYSVYGDPSALAAAP